MKSVFVEIRPSGSLGVFDWVEFSVGSEGTEETQRATALELAWKDGFETRGITFDAHEAWRHFEYGTLLDGGRR